ncbi:very short patch repair endonuclease [Noviherbaspirillum galbum]|uniref:DNA mismatch endonuclease Vsr n=1 Tax=Noviherbaspirillum galbum TaxID=2709383 RepID=A0A6B3SP13_9BURK|nr:very short patch repair endonuclease [Noviherbaspirillum galbum]NEX62473.1 DNA mismatch endonuclease Vsr [Noviherbaspirillum galbum]
MVDVHNPTVRSHNMRAIRSKHTKPELRFRELLDSAGICYEVHSKDLPGTPDIVLRDLKIAMFVNGCFWHGHSCYLFKMPETRREFWQPKIEGTKERDRRKCESLIQEGWRVLIVWECALKGRLRLPVDDLIGSLQAWIAADADKRDYQIKNIECASEPSNHSL